MSEEEKAQLENHKAFVQNTQLMNQIVREMKEIPELPSEVPTDVNPLERVEFPDKGGILTYMGGFEYPYKGFPFHEFVDKIDIIKKILRGTLSSFFHSLRSRNKVQLFFLAFVPWVFNDFTKAMIYTIYRMVERFRIKPLRHCDAMRELHRVLSIEREESVNTQKLRFMVRDVMCMLLEFDNAYRYRFQDIMGELDKDAAKKNPSKEIVRLIGIMQSRELTQEVKDTWTLLRFFLPWYLRFNRTLRAIVVQTLTDINLDEIRLSVEDKSFCEKRKDYKFGFMN